MLADPTTVAPNFSAAASAVEPITPEDGYFGRVKPLADGHGVPLFRPVATAPAKTADEALGILAQECHYLAEREEAMHRDRGALLFTSPEFAAAGKAIDPVSDLLSIKWDLAKLVRPDTHAGLAAKARIAFTMRYALEAGAVREAAPLLLSMAEDAVRLATPAPVWAEQDAAVIAQAKRVARLARMEMRAFGLVSGLEDKVDAMLPMRPSGAEAQHAAEAARKAEMAKIGNVLDYRMNDPVFTEACEKAGAAAETARAPFIAASAARDAERGRLLIETGAEAAAQRQARLGDRLEAAGRQLASMRPRTMAGCVAMAEAAEAVGKAGITGGWGAKLQEAVSRAVAGLQAAPAAKHRRARRSGPVLTQAAA